MIHKDFNGNKKKKKISFGSGKDLEQKSVTVTVCSSPSQYKHNHIKSSFLDVSPSHDHETYIGLHTLYTLQRSNVKRLALEESSLQILVCCGPSDHWPR